MDTKWNRIAEKGKGFTSIAAFLVGVTLLLGSVLGAGKLVLQTPGNMEWWRTDWQETTAFKQNVSWYLKKFLTFTGDVEWYGWEQMQDKAPLLPGGGIGGIAVSETPAAAVEVTPSLTLGQRRQPDEAFRDDTNVLYNVFGGSGSGVSLNNTSDYWEILPEGYNFCLTYQNGRVTIEKNGKELDVYGDGVYDSPEDWYVPGYENFPAGEEKAQIRITVRETPVRFYGDGYYQSSMMYSVYHEYSQYRARAVELCWMLAAAVVCLALAWRLREYRDLGCRAAAKAANFFPAELWGLAAAGFAVYHLFLAGWNCNWMGEVIYLVFTMGEYPAILTGVLYLFWPTVPLYCLGWTLWLICNKNRCIPPEKRRGLLYALRAKDLELPVQKRLQQVSVGGLLSMGVLLAVSALPAWYGLREASYGLLRGWVILGVLLLWDLLLFYLIYSAWKSLRTAGDIGLLAERITAIHSGDLSRTLALPKDADLCRAAEELADIQSGLESALRERTKSERMKVELISNVSHDLKTPLTSVLSYASLLAEEDLPGAAGDYARIILEKARRLDTMVQDVFSISKAAAGQLRLKPERLDLGKLLRQTLADMEDAIAQSGLTIKAELPEQAVEIVADGDRLYRVFQNLVQNALQYSLPGSRIHLTLRLEQGQAVAVLRNTSARELPEGMDFTARFVRGDESRTDGGAGLGLSIAKSFTESCGGSFAVETVADLFTAKVAFPLAE